MALMGLQGTGKGWGEARPGNGRAGERPGKGHFQELPTGWGRLEKGRDRRPGWGKAGTGEAGERRTRGKAATGKSGERRSEKAGAGKSWEVLELLIFQKFSENPISPEVPEL